VAGVEQASALRERVMRVGCAAALVFVASVSAADVAPTGMTQFNVVCPGRTLCATLEAEYQRCRLNRREAACTGFVDAMIKSFSTYDCQRSFDRSASVSYVVPALWMCEEPRRESGAGRDEAYVHLLSQLSFKRARCTFASAAFRSTLDGDLAE